MHHSLSRRVHQSTPLGNRAGCCIHHVIASPDPRLAFLLAFNFATYQHSEQGNSEGGWNFGKSITFWR